MSEVTTIPNNSFNVLHDLFGDYRAEWPPDRFRELFVEPTYFKKLEARRPSLLVGGRGTGKTTVLRSLRFDATLQRLEAQGRGYGDQEHLGIFLRMNKNRVHAFKGGGLDIETWRKSFAHYFNLLACSELARLTIWLEQQVGLTLLPDRVADVCRDLAIREVSTASELRNEIQSSVSELQIFVNNPGHAQQPMLSMAESPLQKFASVLHEENGLTQGRPIFCCIDEYENLLEDQQAILNTYIKHSEPPLSYKVGVRVNGLHTHQTIEGSDLLRTPDDYEQIDIASEGFEYFANAVAERRLLLARNKGVLVPQKLDQFLANLSISDEAILLGAEAVTDRVLEELRSDEALHLYFSVIPKGETYFLQYWAEAEEKTVREMAQDWVDHEQTWRNRLNNYAYASLFWLSRGRKGTRLRKYYCGARTFLALPNGNIRYFLELIDTAIAEQLGDMDTQLANPIIVSAKAQTSAAKTVGQRRLDQLESLADHGVELKRLVLAVGKVFFELARTPLGRAPEVTSFVLGSNGAQHEKVVSLLKEGTAYLAFEATPRTKATTPLEMRDSEYRLHPIFCAFFEISHRRKRRMTFDPGDLLLVLDKPSMAIGRLLEGGIQTNEDELPEQLALFSSFFRGGESA